MGKRVLKWILVLTGLTGVVVLIASGYVCAKSKPYFLTVEEAASKDVDCILVLGAKVYSDGELSGVLRDRADQGLKIYELAGDDSVLLFSGDHGQKDYDEVNALKDYALQHDVPADDIFLDHAGFSTYESMYRLRDIFGARSVIIVTQEYHLYRAVYDARSLGLEAYGVASDLHSYSAQLRFELRELPARAKDLLYCSILRPEPMYLGESINLSGSGVQTHD